MYGSLFHSIFAPSASVLLPKVNLRELLERDFYGPDALPNAQPTVSKTLRQ